MPSKKRKYNARFPAGRIKKIMQTDEEVGKVAQAVPIVISRALELFVESLLKKAMQVTSARNAKMLSPSHIKQCILSEARFDFLRDLVKNIPDVSAAEEKEMVSAESSPNSSRYVDTAVPRKIAREDSNSSSSCDVKIPIATPSATRTAPEVEPKPRTEVTSTIVSTDTAIDLTKKKDEERPRMANFYQETLIDPQVQHRSVIQINPTYSSPQPSTSYIKMTPVEPVQRLLVPMQKPPVFDLRQNNNLPQSTTFPNPPKTPVTPVINIDFTKSIAKPEIKVLDTAAVNIPGKDKKVPRQYSRQPKPEVKQDIVPTTSQSIDIDHLNSGNLQIDEDYDT